MSEINFEDVGRNDPCPCGSGKKFKKCHERELRLQKEAQKKSRNAHDLINESTIPWAMYKLLVQVRENNLIPLFHEMTHELGPLRGQYDTAEAYIKATEDRETFLPCAEGFDLRRIRLDGPDVHLLLAKGIKDPKLKSVTFDVVTLRPNEIDKDRNPRDAEHLGWRVWNIERHERNKSELEHNDLTLEELGYTWAEAWSQASA